MPLSLSKSGHSLKQILVVSDHDLSQVEYEDMSPDTLEQCLSDLDYQEEVKMQDIKEYYSRLKKEINLLLDSNHYVE